MAGKQLLSFRNILLSNHVLDGRVNLYWHDGIDCPERETHEAITDALLQLVRQGVGELDGLIFNADAANGDGICPNGARGGGEVAVGDIPC